MTSGFQIAAGIALIIIMFGMGLSLIPDDFKKASSPRAISLGLFNQLVVLPLIAFALLMVFSVSPEIAIGVMIIAACPGGATSNLVANIAKADTALSIYLTVISSLITIVTIPFLINFSLDYFAADGQQVVKLDPVETIKKIFVVIVIPVIVGMLIRYKFPDFSKRMEKPVKIASALFISFVIFAGLYDQRDAMLGYIAVAGPLILSLNILVMVVAYLSATWFLKSGRDALTIVIESGIQNGALAILIAVSMLENPAYAIAPMVYSLLMFLTVFAYISYLKKRLNIVMS